MCPYFKTTLYETEKQQQVNNKNVFIYSIQV